jgi:hypothetical protein
VVLVKLRDCNHALSPDRIAQGLRIETVEQQQPRIRSVARCQQSAQGGFSTAGRPLQQNTLTGANPQAQTPHYRLGTVRIAEGQIAHIEQRGFRAARINARFFNGWSRVADSLKSRGRLSEKPNSLPGNHRGQDLFQPVRQIVKCLVSEQHAADADG